MRRIHNLSVTVAKHVFEHPEYGIVFSREPLRTGDAKKQFKLKPLLLYTVNVPGTPIKSIRYHPYDNPVSLINFLLDTWENDELLRGSPDEVRINNQLAKSTDKLEGFLSQAGIQLSIIKGYDRAFSAATRNAQNFFGHMSFGSTTNKQKLKSLSSLNKASIIACNNPYFMGERRDDPATIQFLQQEVMTVRPITRPDILDWELGKWLYSWENSLPPLLKCNWYDGDTAKWLIQEEVAETSESELEIMKAAKNLVDCFPFTLSQFAAQLGTTAKELKWYLDGKKSDAEFTDFFSNYFSFSIEWHEAYDGYTFPSVETAGFGYILKATKQKSLRDVYNLITCGGDIGYCFEALPEEDDHQDSQYCYFCFSRCDGPLNVVVAEKGTKYESMTKKTMFNFTGSRTVEDELYLDIVNTVKKCLSADVLNNRIIGIELSERWSEHLYPPYL